jgi:hypothetical protein
MLPNNRIHSDSKKRRFFVALLFAAGDARRWASSKQRGKYAIWENKEAKSKGHLA